MILKALCDYYDRCGDMPVIGTELKEIGYVIVIDEMGNYVRIDSQMIDRRKAKEFLVAQTIKRSGTKYVANYLWDNIDYVLGYNENNPDKAIICKQKFVERVKELKTQIPNNPCLKSICLFYEKFDENFEIIKQSELWTEIIGAKKNLSFLLNGQISIAAVEKEVINKVTALTELDNLPICLVTGKRGTTARLHTNVPLSGNRFTSLVSFQKNSGYDSYGHEQAFNAPVSEDAVFKYTTALNKLLKYESHNQFKIGSRTFAFWASSNNEVSNEAETSMFELFGINTENIDDPNARIESVRKVFNDIYSGLKPTSDDDRFYILGLAPNAARIAVVYWNECSLKEFAGLILRHFDDTEIVGARKEQKPYQGLHAILKSVTMVPKNGRWQEIVQPNMLEATIKSIMQGLPYPASLYQACIRRIRAEQEVSPYGSPCRPAIIKAYLNRLNDNNEKIKIMLDKENKNPGYLCGRLFATLEKIQEDANHIHSVRDRYMNAASSTPSSVFATILNLSVHHSEKLSTGKQIFYEKLKQEIIEKLPSDGFPNHLDLQDQGRFFVGYYQQRQDFYTNKDAQDSGASEE